MGLIQRELRTNPGFDPGFSETSFGGNWFAITVKPQNEQVVRMGLEAKQLNCYVPTYSSLQQWSDRLKRVERPLFAGYVFSQFEPADRTMVLRTPGVRSIVSFGAEMSPVPCAELEKISRLLASPYLLEPWPFLQAGQRVKIASGPLSGIEGLFERRDHGGRLVISIEILRRSVAVHLEAGNLTPLDSPAFLVQQ
jgi:transcription antitermination factor NusG